MLPRFPSRPTGFTVLEVLIAVFIMASLTVAITSLAILGTRTAGESERHTVALGLVNQQIERIRILAYDEIGYTSPQPGEPDGALERTAVLDQNQQPYTIGTTITLVDDPLNGSASPLTEATADYKKVQVSAAWQARGGVARDVTVVTYVAVGAVPSVSPPSPTPSPAPTPSLSPSPTPIITPTLTPSPTSTPTPTFTFPPPPTATPTPSCGISGISCSTNAVCCSNVCTPLGFCT